MESRAAQLETARWATPEWKLTVASPEQPAAGAALRDTAGDAELVRATLAGNRQAFDLIVTRYRRPIYHLCLRYVGRHEDAADLAQEVFLRAYRGLGGFQGKASFSTWLYRIGVNVCLNRVSAKTPRLEQMEPLDEARRVAGGEGPADALLREERAARVRAAIAQLPPKQRATLVLRVYQELSHEEIAKILGSSVGACKANFFHALRKLRALLQS
ncbi:MAG TPA: RNA polymerase sigma factor [Vicinamibacterales bacterium]|nr:RNA polymerase sigma factor [Vicinamibacterales bacterium]